MVIDQITKDNLDTYSDLVDEDVLENIGRKFFEGIAVFDEDKFKGAIIWSYLFVDDPIKTPQSRIHLFKCDDAAAGKVLLDDYFESIKKMNVHRNIFAFRNDLLDIEKSALKYAGFEISKGIGYNIYTSIGELKNLDVIKKTKHISPDVKPLLQLTPRNYRRGIVDCLVNINREVIEDLCTLTYDWYEPDISCYIENEGDVCGYLLIHKLVSGTLRIELMSEWGAARENILVDMMRFAAMHCIAKYPDDTMVVLHTFDEAADKLVNYLLPEIKKPEFTVGVCEK